MMRAMGNHIQIGILRAVAELIGASDDRKKTILVVEEVRSVEWASATFVGARHEIDLRIEGEATKVTAALARMVAELSDLEIPVAGHIIAEISASLRPKDECETNLELGTRFVTVNALTIID